MTDTEVGVETVAHRVAARGREALVERLRRAYDDAAAAHADLISLDRERIEAMVQSAVDRADGLQWRRALADVAAEELGVSATDALSSPVVARAQELVGAPSYEQSLAELIARPVPPPAPDIAAGANGHVATEPERASAEAASAEGAPAETASADAASAESPMPEPPTPEPPAPEPPTPSPEPERPTPEPGATHRDELETVEADDVVLELLPEPDPIEYETETYEVEASFTEEQAPPAPHHEAAHEPARASDFEPQPAAAFEPPPAAPFEPEHESEPETATHEPAPTFAPQQAAHEPAPLAAASDAAEVQFPAIHLGGVANLPTKRDGLNVRLSADGLDILQGERDIIGRLIWDEIEALEVPELRARRRQKQLRARLVVRTPHGDASFEVPDIATDELRDRVEPFMERFGRQ